jgi:hypothetical protein
MQMHPDTVGVDELVLEFAHTMPPRRDDFPKPYSAIARETNGARNMFDRASNAAIISSLIASHPGGRTRQ